MSVQKKKPEVPPLTPSPIGVAIKFERTSQKLTLRDLALKAGTSYQTILRLERGLGSMRTGVKVLRALAIDASKIQKLVARESARLMEA